LLLGADFLCNAAQKILVAQHLAHVETGAWWPEGTAAMEAIELLLYGSVFAIAGALVARINHSCRGILFAVALGLAYSLLAFALEPNLPFARYSHAPTWLWVLSWSKFYMPVFSCAPAALSIYAFRGVASGRRNAA
jgi:hypothetical protein